MPSPENIESRLPALHRLNLLAGLLLVCVAGYAAMAGANAVPWLERYGIPCFFKQVTHLPCLFCGFTRSLVSLMQGDVRTSLAYHPLGAPLTAMALVFLSLSALSRPAALWILKQASRRPVILGIIGILTATWLWKVSHDPLYW